MPFDGISPDAERSQWRYSSTIARSDERSSEICDPDCDVCGERCKRAAVAGLGAFAYAGDGVSDRCVSLAAERRFARAGLADWLDDQGVGYEPFDDLYDIARALG